MSATASHLSWFTYYMGQVELAIALLTIYRYTRSFKLDEFISRAPLEKYVRVQQHLKSFLMLSLMSTCLGGMPQ